jgi:hypothetical protein
MQMLDGGELSAGANSFENFTVLAGDSGTTAGAPVEAVLVAVQDFLLRDNPASLQSPTSATQGLTFFHLNVELLRLRVTSLTVFNNSGGGAELLEQRGLGSHFVSLLQSFSLYN